MLGLADSIVGVAGKVLDKFVEDKDLKTKFCLLYTSDAADE